MVAEDEMQALPHASLVSLAISLQKALHRERSGEAFRDRVLDKIAPTPFSKPITGITFSGRKPKAL
jgi:hypothetical protein